MFATTTRRFTRSLRRPTARRMSALRSCHPRRCASTGARCRGRGQRYAGDRSSGERSHLAAHHEGRESRHIADQDRSGQQIRQEAQARGPGDQAGRPTMAASAAYRSGSPAAIGPSAAAMSKAVVDSGPTESRREDPIRAWASSAATAAQRPAAGRQRPQRGLRAASLGQSATVVPSARVLPVRGQSWTTVVHSRRVYLAPDWFASTEEPPRGAADCAEVSAQEPHAGMSGENGGGSVVDGGQLRGGVVAQGMHLGGLKPVADPVPVQ